MIEIGTAKNRQNENAQSVSEGRAMSPMESTDRNEQPQELLDWHDWPALRQVRKNRHPPSWWLSSVYCCYRFDITSKYFYTMHLLVKPMVVFVGQAEMDLILFTSVSNEGDFYMWDTQSTELLIPFS